MSPVDPSRRQLRAVEERQRAQRHRRRARRPLRRPADTRPPLRSPAVASVALISVALLVVSASLPAIAVNPAASDVPPPGTSAAGRVQHLPANSGESTIIQRDGYTAAVVSKPTRVARTAGTFVNYLGPIQWPFPVGVPISTYFGPRVPPCSGCSSFHKGLDMNPGADTPVQAIADGVVREVSATDKSGLGVYAIIDHMDDGRKVSSLYAHMRGGSLALSPGQPVLVGQRIGNVGTTGQSTGPHLHFEILLDGVTPTDPFGWLSQRVRPE